MNYVTLASSRMARQRLVAFASHSLASTIVPASQLSWSDAAHARSRATARVLPRHAASTSVDGAANASPDAPLAPG